MNEAVEEMIEDLSASEFVCFAGAGVPEPTRVPMWKELLVHLQTKEPAPGLHIEEVDAACYPDAAEMLYKAFEKAGKAEVYGEVIQQAMVAKGQTHTPAQQLMVQVSGCIVTTNFDDTFEVAFKEVNVLRSEGGEVECQVLGDLDVGMTAHRNYITYLHGRAGDLDKDGQLVFRTSEYVRNYPALSGVSEESKVEQILKYIYEKKKVLFVGFSFKDYYITRTLERIHSALDEDKLRQIKHYALLEQLVSPDEKDPRVRNEAVRQEKQDEDFLGNLNIKAVWYPYQDHVQIENWLKLVRQRQQRQRMLVRPETTVYPPAGEIGDGRI